MVTLESKERMDRRVNQGTWVLEGCLDVEATQELLEQTASVPSASRDAKVDVDQTEHEG